MSGCRWLFGGKETVTWSGVNPGTKWYSPELVKSNLLRTPAYGVINFQDGHYELSVPPHCGKWSSYPDLDTLVVALTLRNMPWLDRFLEWCGHCGLKV